MSIYNETYLETTNIIFFFFGEINLKPSIAWNFIRAILYIR